MTAALPGCEVERRSDFFLFVRHVRVLKLHFGQFDGLPLPNSDRPGSILEVLAHCGREAILMLFHGVPAVAEPSRHRIQHLLGSLGLGRLRNRLLERVPEHLGLYDPDLLLRSVLLVRRPLVEDLEQREATHDATKDGVLIVQVRARLERHEELAPVGVFAVVCHAHNSAALVAEPRVELVSEGLSPFEGALPALACACGVAALYHEVLDQSVEDRVVIIVLLT
mmetsp:Transcript_19865/g.54871  ORF Transcript_19865/g.54871 Transcript_19865/m.54871 type:complete len:224 (-) Transcript_19865:1077-1748(-)